MPATLTKYGAAIQQNKEYINNIHKHSLFVDDLENEILSEHCKDILKEAARSYQWYGESFFHSKGRVADARRVMCCYVCECLSEELFICLIEKIDSLELQFDDLGFLNILTQNSKLDNVKDKLVASFQLIIFGAVWDTLQEMFMIFMVSFRGIDVNDCSFRDEIAENTYIKIESKRHLIAKKVVRHFCEEMKKKMKDLSSRFMNSEAWIETLHRKLDEYIRYEWKVFNIDTVIKRNPLVCRIFPPMDIDREPWRVYVKDKEENVADLWKYTKLYLGKEMRYEVYENT